jgi:hypothetical protein
VNILLLDVHPHKKKTSNFTTCILSVHKKMKSFLKLLFDQSHTQ